MKLSFTFAFADTEPLWRPGLVAFCAAALLGAVAGPALAAPNPDIELLQTGSLASAGVDYDWAYFRNVGHPCGKNDGANAATNDLLGTSDAYSTFMILSPIGLGTSVPAPLYVHSHGGLIGAFSATTTYPGTTFPAYDPGNSQGDGESRIDQETAEELGLISSGDVVPEDRGNPKLTAGLLNELRLSGNNFRFLFTSMCDHDVYSGEGVFDEAASGFNPYNVDSSGNAIERRADGLTTSFESLQFVEDEVSVSHLFLGGTSAGSIGSLALGFKLEGLGRPATGIIGDSHDDSLEIADLTDDSCYAFTTAHTATIRTKIEGPNVPTRTSAARVSVDDLNELPNTPLLHVWDQNDVGGDKCPNPGGPSGTFGDTGLTPLYANDWHHIRLAQALTSNKGRGNPAHDASHNVWLCVADPVELRACAEHSPTKYTVGNSVGHKTTENPSLIGYADLVATDYNIDYVNPVDYPLLGDGDYNKWIMDWIQRRIDGVPESRSVPAFSNTARGVLVLLFLGAGWLGNLAKRSAFRATNRVQE